MPNTSRAEIESFLSICRRHIRTSFEFLIRRQKNKDTILELEYNQQDVINEICSLTVENYSDGPLKDRTYTDQVWIFGKIIKSKEVYIKIQLSQYNDPGDLIDTVYCISFHFSDEKLDCPYQS